MASGSSRDRRRPAEVDIGDPALPVAGSGSLSGVRKSRRSKWRAVVLFALYVAIALHATHYLLEGRTLSPVEPSEAMYTLELGEVNAGFVFFVVALLATAILGRFVCGWGCHLVALQDACGWLMRRAGVRPRPFRSRFLAWAPLVLALYMFVWPTVKRLLPFLDARPFPGFSNQLMTDGFWDTFSGPVWATLTLVCCGFVAVYFLGAKGFCTYGCPYGAFFAATDRLAPWRIRVTDACEQCGHCTATCTSNVTVHEEVRLYGMVVSPGCMKCLDCVSVCPKDALYFGRGRPSLFRGAPDGNPTRRFDLSLSEEILVAVVAVAATLSFRGLYDGPPLLMAIGLGGITAFLALTGWRLLRRPTVRVQNFALKLGGQWSASGRWFALGLVAWLLLSAHSGFVQWHRHRGADALERTEATRSEALSGAASRKEYSPEHRLALEQAHRHFDLADRWGLKPVLGVKLGLAWTSMLRAEVEPMRRALEGAIAIAPGRADLRRDLATALAAAGRLDDAADELEPLVAGDDPAPADLLLLAGLSAELGRTDRAIELYGAYVSREPDSFPAHYNLGGLLRRAGRSSEAVEVLLVAATLSPNDRDTRVELGLACKDAGLYEEARLHLLAAIEIAPDHPESRFHLPGLIESLGVGSGSGAAGAGGESKPDP